MRYALTLLVLSLAAGRAARAQELWTLSTADFKTEQVALHGIDDEKGVSVIAVGETTPRVVPPAAFLQVDRDLPAATAGATKFMLHLSTGDRVAGEPVKVENDQLTWNNPAVGELVVPLTQLAAITTPDQRPDPAAKRTEDVVALANGDTVRGIVTGMAGGQVQVKAAGGDEPVAVPMDAVVSVHFATAAAGAAATPPAVGQGGSRLYRVRLDDGSSVVGTAPSLAAGKLSLVIGGSPTGGAAGTAPPPRALDLGRVTAIEQVNGPVSWLTSRTPSEDLQVPFVAAEQPLWRTRVDTDVAGDPFVVGGRALSRGLGVHAYSRLTYPLDGTFKAFRTRYGINDSLVRADVTVRVRLGDKVVHEAKNVRSGVLSPVVMVELGDAKELTLEVDYGQGIDVEDRLNWLEPALLREVPKAEGPAAQPAPQPAAATEAPNVPATPVAPAPDVPAAPAPAPAPEK